MKYTIALHPTDGVLSGERGQYRFVYLPNRGDYTLPSTDGSSNQVLKTNGSGTLSWQNDSGISLTSLSASAPLSQKLY